MQNKTTIVVHNGKFHADDVFAVAILMLIIGNKNSEVIRTRDEEWFKKGDYVLDVGFVYDPGANRFDHHQQGGAGMHPNGIPYASLGLVWQKFGKELCGSQEVADALDKKLVSYIDAVDNGVDTYTLKYPDAPIYSLIEIIELFRPTWKTEERDVDLEFLEAVEWAQKILNLEIEATRYELGVEAEVEYVYSKTEDKRLIIFDENKKVFSGEMVSNILAKYPEPLYLVIFKNEPANWQVIAIRKNLNSFELRKPLPEHWGGLMSKELEAVTDVPGSLFCHRGKFLCVADSKEGALKLAQLVLES